jgi:CheY-like chemotaxis protein
MDLEMPVMDGLTAARTIREYEADGTIVKHVPIIAVTANARLEQIETAKAAGMVRIVASLKESYSNEWQDDVVSKPFRIPELIPKIEELITKSNATSTL